jgi:hypothetical protein
MTKDRLKSLQKHCQRHYAIICGVLIGLVGVWGVFTTWATYNRGFDLGDAATYYALAREVTHGQVAYKDFVHFKTPAATFLEAGTMRVFGDSQSSVMLGVKLETNVLYPMVFLLAVSILFRRSKNNLLYAILATLVVLYLPPLAGLRAGFAFLAVCVYLASFDYVDRRRPGILLAAGAAVGAAFMFGQDMMLVAAATIAAGEVFNWRDKQVWRRIGWLMGGFLLGAAPLVLYVTLLANIGTFLYYIGYYGLVLQPRYMNTPMPGLSWSSLMYYVPFIIYLACFLQLLWDRRSDRRDALLLSFGILRLATLLGRSDFGHLLFSLPELFIVGPYFMARIPSMQISRKRIQQSFPYAAFVIGVFWAAIATSNVVLLAIPFLALAALRHNDRLGDFRAAPAALKFNMYAALGALMVLMTYWLFPAAYSNAQSAKAGALSRQTGPYAVSGMSANPATYREVQAVSSAVRPYHPQTIFSFPIQAHFYSLAPRAATRFITFEPETTLKEQDQAIADLRRTKPEVIVFDALQAQSFSASSWKISEYVLSNYEVAKVIAQRNIFWIMVPRHDDQKSYPLLFRLLKDNPGTAAQGIQLNEQGIMNALGQPDKKLRFTIQTLTDDTSLQIGVLVNQEIAQGQTARCGDIAIAVGNKTHQQEICQEQGRQIIKLGKHEKVTISLINKDTYPLVWDSPEIINVH